MRDVSGELADIEARGLTRKRRMLESAQGVRVEVDGRPFLSFSSNDYLGLAADPRVIEALCEGARRYGAGAGASHLAGGHHRSHDILEKQLAALVQQPRALLFSSGYLANLGLVTTLAGPDSEIFADRLNHASLNDTLILSRAKFRRYAHGRVEALADLMEKSRAGHKLVITDAVFSMDGDLAPLREIVQLCQQHGAQLVVDDAHGFGVLGDGGGALVHLQVGLPGLVYMGTLGKAAGVSGAFVAGAHEMIELLIQRARSYIYTTAGPPALAMALAKSVELIRDEPWRRERLREHAEQLSRDLRLRRWRLLVSPSAIQPVIIGGNEETQAASEMLYSQGLLVPAIRPPTVPKGTARLRISLSAAHTREDVARLIEALQSVEEALA
jgi:8-amino-7-oxononanoate synthase